MAVDSFTKKDEAALRDIDRLLAAGGVKRRSRRRSASRPSGPASGGNVAEREGRNRRVEVIRAPGWLRGAAIGAARGNPESNAKRADWLVHGFSTRIGGLSRVYGPQPGEGTDLNLAFTREDDRETVAANRELFAEAVTGGRSEFQLVVLEQIHSTLMRRIFGGRRGAKQAAPGLRGDGLMTSVPGILLGIVTADCLPVLVADRRNRAVAAFHAGWRGTLRRIVETGVGRMRLEFGSRPEDMIAAVGPGIGQCCYAVGEEVQHEFESQFSYAGELFREVSDSDPIKEKYPLLFLTARAPGHSNLGPSLHLDLAEANRRQLVQAGVPASAIWVAQECTACHLDRFFSYRGERGFTGRMMSVIGIRGSEAR